MGDRSKNPEKCRENDKKYREKNRERVRANQKRYWEKNSASILAKMKSCREADKEQSLEEERLYREANRERVREISSKSAKKRYHEDPGSAREKVAGWRIENPDKVLEMRKTYQEEHGEAIQARKRLFREQNPDKVREYDRRHKSEKASSCLARKYGENHDQRSTEAS